MANNKYLNENENCIENRTLIRFWLFILRQHASIYFLLLYYYINICDSKSIKGFDTHKSSRIYFTRKSVKLWSTSQHFPTCRILQGLPEYYLALEIFKMRVGSLQNLADCKEQHKIRLYSNFKFLSPSFRYYVKEGNILYRCSCKKCVYIIGWHSETSCMFSSLFT